MCLYCRWMKEFGPEEVAIRLWNSDYSPEKAENGP
jgi:hypothetical protein